MKRDEDTYSLMLGTILLGHVLAVGNKLLHGRVDYNLLGDGVAGQLPDELVLPADLGVLILGSEDVLVLLLKLGMVVLDAVRDLGAGGAGHCADVDGLEEAGSSEGGANSAVGDALGNLSETSLGSEAIHVGGSVW